jgi:uncharacterized protein (DUF1697 family)
MKVYIALLRGVNVGGKNKILMAELRELFEAIGLLNVKTYIQSGNIVFTSKEKSCAHLEFYMKEAIQSRFNLEVPVIVKTKSGLQQVFNDCPFSEDKKQKSYFSMLYEAPNETLINEVSKIKYENEEVVVTPKCVYFYSSIGYGKTKYNNNFFERKLQVVATARNYKTMVKLLDLASVQI